jgi:hypothetical protein
VRGTVGCLPRRPRDAPGLGAEALDVAAAESRRSGRGEENVGCREAALDRAVRRRADLPEERGRAKPPARIVAPARRAAAEGEGVDAGEALGSGAERCKIDPSSGQRIAGTGGRTRTRWKAQALEGC